MTYMPILGRGRGGSISLVPFPADYDQIHNIPKIDLSMVSICFNYAKKRSINVTRLHSSKPNHSCRYKTVFQGWIQGFGKGGSR